MGDSLVTAIPRDYQLFQNYPNPFNPDTRIAFDLPKNEYVTVNIFDMRGAEVITLIDGLKQTGHHELIWDGKDKLGNHVTSGVYFCKIQAGRLSQVRKMLLIR